MAEVGNYLKIDLMKKRRGYLLSLRVELKTFHNAEVGNYLENRPNGY